MKQWKICPIDAVALKHWEEYSAARNEMLSRTHNEITPWYVVRADSKKRARVNLIRHLLSKLECPDRDEHAATPDPEVVFAYSEHVQERGLLAL